MATCLAACITACIALWGRVGALSLHGGLTAVVENPLGPLHCKGRMRRASWHLPCPCHLERQQAAHCARHSHPRVSNPCAVCTLYFHALSPMSPCAFVQCTCCFDRSPCSTACAFMQCTCCYDCSPCSTAFAFMQCSCCYDCSPCSTAFASTPCAATLHALMPCDPPLVTCPHDGSHWPRRASREGDH